MSVKSGLLAWFRVRRHLCRLFLGLAAALALPAKGLTLAENGKASATIVFAADASATDQMAADELAEYLRRISGANFVVLPEDKANSTGSRVFVGSTAFARSNGVTSDKLGPEEWVIRTVGSNLVILGGEPRGMIRRPHV